MYHGQIKIFAQSATPRLIYIAELIFGNILGSDWRIITDKRDTGDDPVINYSSETITGSLKMKPHPLLFEDGIRRFRLTADEWKGIPTFFMTDEDADLPYDIFAASFYLVSRYEEYMTFKPDKHGRFPASSSFAFRNGFLRIPVVDLWAKELAGMLALTYPGLTFRNDGYSALLTVDSDQPFAYLGKNLLRTAAGLIHDIAARPGNAGERFRVLTNQAKDPFDVFNYLISKVEETGTDSRFFFPAGKYTKYDKNPFWRNTVYRELIKRISSKYKAGIHPSYYSSDNYAVLEKELVRLGSIIEKDITISRFHFLRLKIPVSYKILEKAGIKEDYSMGFPDEPGFRAGIARPFLFYNLAEERQTGLRIVPLLVMDATLYQYLKLDAHSAEKVIAGIISETRKAGGLFVSLWHNTSLTEKSEWEGCRKLFEKMLIIQKP